MTDPSASSGTNPTSIFTPVSSSRNVESPRSSAGGSSSAIQGAVCGQNLPQDSGLESSQYSGLRASQSFGSKVDEGYSGEEIPTPILFEAGHDRPGGVRDQNSEVKIPPWMTGLNDAMREEFAYKLVRTLPTSHIASLVNRLVPILHIDFIQVLPSELSLQILSYLSPKSLLNASLASRQWRKFALEPRLWRDMYKAYGWQADEEEVRRFEAEIRTRHEEDTRQQMESKRKAEESNEEERKVKEARRATAFSHTGVVPSSSQPIDISQDWSHDAIEPNPVEGSFVTATRAPPLFSSFPSVTSDEDETYPSQPNRRSIGSRKFQSFSEPLLIIQPKLTIVPSGYGYPRLNWAFLFKNRCRLEENWLHNRCIPFQIPHPNYPRESHRECIYTIQYSPKWLCSGSRDRTVRVWDIRTRRLRGEPLFGHQGSVLCLQFDESPDEDVIISGSSDASVIVWRFSTGEKLQIIPRAHDESVLNLRFSKRWLVTCSKDKLIKIWNRFPLETTDPDYPWNSKLVFGPNRAPLNHPHHPNYQPTWKIEDPSMSSGLNYQNPFNRDYNLKPRPHKWVTPKTLTPYTAVQDLQGHVAAVNAIQLHGNEIVSASGDRVIKLWNLRTAQCEKTFVGHQKGIACIQFDGETIVSGSSDQTIRVFDRNTQAEIATLRGHSALVRTVQATRNKIVSGSYDESVRIWRRDEETGSWIPGTVLRQAQTPILITPSRPSQVHAPIQTQQPMQMAATQQFHAHATSGGNIASVQMHQIQQVGPGMPGALAASQLLPSTNQQYFPQPQHHPEQQQDGHPTVPELAAESLALAAPAAQFLLAAAQGSSTTPITQAQHAATAAAAVVAAAAAATSTVIPGTTSNGAHRIFKLQFDARWIMCCSQDTRIMGWDFAADDESVAEASRFFLGDN